MKFSEALLTLSAGCAIKRPEWGDGLLVIEDGKMMLKIKEGIKTELKVINTEDILSNDWEDVHES